MGFYTISHTDGSTFKIYDLEQNGPNSLSTPRQLLSVIPGTSGNNKIIIAGDMLYRFVPGFTFNLIDSASNNGLYTVSSAILASGNTEISTTSNIVNAILPLGNLIYTIPEIESDLLLSGKGIINFGKDLNQNFIKILENFASTVPPSNPILGQQWYNTSTNTMITFDNTNQWNYDTNIASGALTFIDPQHPTNSTTEVITISADDNDVGLSLKIDTNPNIADSIFRVLSDDNNERLRVEHDGYVSTTNSIKSTGTTLLNLFSNSIQFNNNKGITSSIGSAVTLSANGNTWEIINANNTNAILNVNDYLSNNIVSVLNNRVEIKKDLIVNTSTLVVNVTTNMIGVNKIIPTQALDVVGNIAYSNQLLSSNGTILNPGISFNNNNTAGFRLIGSNVIGVTLGGSDKMLINSTGLLSTNTVSYENLVLADNDIPNKKYVDNITASAGRAKLFFYAFS